MSRIREYHYYHGAALAMIAEQDNFTAINRVPGYESRSIYMINNDRILYIKHCKSENNEWRFTFATDHQEDIRRLYDHYGDSTFVILVCNDLVCSLTFGEYARCVDQNFIEGEWLEVWRPEGGGFRVRGTRGDLELVVPLNRFPALLFRR